MGFTLWLWLTVCHGTWPIEIDGLPINSMVIFHVELLNNQMVNIVNKSSNSVFRSFQSTCFCPFFLVKFNPSFRQYLYLMLVNSCSLVDSISQFELVKFRICFVEFRVLLVTYHHLCWVSRMLPCNVGPHSWNPKFCWLSPHALGSTGYVTVSSCQRGNMVSKPGGLGYSIVWQTHVHISIEHWDTLAKLQLNQL